MDELMQEIKKLLSGYTNTRNFSYISSIDKKAIRPCIIRSNTLTTKEQISSLITNEPKTIIDFRIKKEGGGKQNLAYPHMEIIHLPIPFGNMNIDIIKKLLIDGEIEKIDSFMESGYRTFSSDFKQEIQIFFWLLLDSGNLPVIFHCSAGKDRTGIFSVLFLLALGISQDDVIDDYMLTNESTTIDNNQKLDILFKVKRDWIEIFINEINKKHGSVELYLSNEIEVDTKKLRALYYTN